MTPFSTAINSIYHDGPATFSKNQDTIIFTRSNFYHWRFKKSDEGVNKLKLFVATWDALLKCWANIKPMQFNSDQYSVGHPALSKDGSDLYFASDMPGGLGGTDIYVSHKITDSLGNRKWGEPVNLGAEINTRGNEMFPFVDNEGNLWFASNGLPGLGGLDVFVAKKTANGFAKPVNPGYPLNTRFDDFAYITQNGGKDGYISSDRYNKIGDDDIFSVTLNKLALIGLVRDTTNQNKPVENAEVDLCFSDNSLVNKVQTKTDGMFEFPLSFDKNYTVKALKTGYADNKQGLSTVGSKAGKISFIMNLGKARQVVLFCTVIDKKTGEKLNDVEINIVDTCKQLLVADTTTSVDGSFRKSVPNVKINDKLGYQITINKKGYLTKKVSFDHIVTSYEIDLNNFLEVSLDKIDVGTDIGKLLKINPIYFDLGKWDIRKDAAVELDKVVKAMIDNPNLVIELGSHTDSRGSSQSNLILSDKRAKSSVCIYCFERH